MKHLCAGISTYSFDVSGEVLKVMDSDFSSICISPDEFSDKILVVDVPSPSIVLVLQNVKALITRRGGLTCHAASICRELGKPAIVGCSDILDLVSSGSFVRMISSNNKGDIYEIDSI